MYFLPDMMSFGCTIVGSLSPTGADWLSQCTHLVPEIVDHNDHVPALTKHMLHCICGPIPVM